MLKQADKKCKKHELVRRRSETLNQFADRIEAFCASEERHMGQPDHLRLQALPNWYRQFASARYQGMRPSPLT